MELARPELTPENELILAVWNFCKGWEPSLFELAAAYYDIEDADFMMSQLSTMREVIDAHKAAQRKA